MTKPVEGVASITQSQNAQDIVQTAQRLAALAQMRHELAAMRAKDVQRTSVTKQEKAGGKTIRDDDPRKGQPRRQKPEEQPEEESAEKHVDITA